MSLAVIRIRGTRKFKKGVADTLRILGLSKSHSCVVLDKNPINEGMIIKVKDYVTWGEIKPDVLKQLEEKNHSEQARKAFQHSVEKGKGKSFNLAPPKGGFSKKGIVAGFRQGGELGYRGEKINELIERMI